MPVLRPRAVEQRQRADVPALRDEAVRAPRLKGVSRRRGGRSGVSVRVANDVIGRLRDIRAVWCAVQNDPNKTVTEVAAEFYFVVGEILEGRTLRSLSLRNIDRERVIAHVEE